MGDETTNAIYIWKKERSFDIVFPGLGVSDDSEEAEVKPKLSGTIDTIDTMIKAKLDQPSELVTKEPDPVSSSQKENKVSKTISEKISDAKKLEKILQKEHLMLNHP